MTADHLGSPRIVTDVLGHVRSRHDYLAYGDEVTDKVGNVAGRTTANGYGEEDDVRKQYTGYERDDESGLDFAQARYYNPSHGRYTGVDPLTASADVRNPQTFNRYSYVLNSPYKFTDPLGLISSQTGACGQWCRNNDGGSAGWASQYQAFESSGTEWGVFFNRQYWDNSKDEGRVVHDNGSGDMERFRHVAHESPPNAQQLHENAVFILVSVEGVGFIQLKNQGSLSEGNRLNFQSNSNRELGGNDGADGWFWNVEISGEVNGDVSKWYIGQRMTTTITYQEIGSSESTTVTTRDQLDSPIAEFRQQDKGQGKFFALDSPGARYSTKFYEFFIVTQKFYTYIERGDKRIGFKWTLKTEIRGGITTQEIFSGH